MKFHSNLSNALAKSIFYHEISTIPRIKREGVGDFLSYNDIITNTPTFDESLL
jgi:hypothetical protein